MILKELLFAQFLFILIQLSKGDIVVNSENGPIRGKTTASGKVEAFLGIPFAEPPVGNLRFVKPVPKASWNDVYEATQSPPVCVQIDFGKTYFTPNVSQATEDCLYLNVWMPHPKDGDDELKAVMFFIHAGSFIFGHSDFVTFNGAKLAENGDVVVVSTNYRVGALGFYTDFSDDAPGNIGLHDQVLALRWFKDNAKHFHGDPDKITIFGESAGSTMISLHLISPLSKNLFRSAIMQSGSSINPTYNNKNKLIGSVSKLYATELGCLKNEKAKKDSKAVLECMRKVSTKKIMEVEYKVAMKKMMQMAPRVGDDFLPQNPIDMFNKGFSADTPVILGIDRDEGSFLLTRIDLNFFGEFGEKVDENLFDELTAYNIIKYALLSRNIDLIESEKIIQSYLDDADEEKGHTYLRVTRDAIGDLLVTCNLIFQAEYMSKKGTPVYFYKFDFLSSAAPYAEWMGVPHFEEAQFVFGNPLFEEFTEEEKELSSDMMKMWTNLAKTGNPNIPGGVEWPKYNYKDPKYYIIGGRDHVDTVVEKQRCDRWRKVFTKFN